MAAAAPGVVTAAVAEAEAATEAEAEVAREAAVEAAAVTASRCCRRIRHWSQRRGSRDEAAHRQRDRCPTAAGHGQGVAAQHGGIARREPQGAQIDRVACRETGERVAQGHRTAARPELQNAARPDKVDAAAAGPAAEEIRGGRPLRCR